MNQYNVGMYLVQAIAHEDLRGELSLGNDEGAVTIIRFKSMGRSELSFGKENPSIGFRA